MKNNCAPNIYTAEGWFLRCLLNTQQSFIVDVSDYELICGHRWYISAYGYPVTSIPGGGKMFLHRLLLNAVAGVEVDHISGDKLDNRRSNLRPVNKRENQCNVKPRSTNTTGYKGVCNHKNGKYAAAIKAGRNIYLGYFSTPEEAAAAYNAAAIKHFGEYARLNVIGRPFHTVSMAEFKEVV